MEKDIEFIKRILLEEKKIVSSLKEANSYSEKVSFDEKKLLENQIKELETKLSDTQKKLEDAFSSVLFSKPLEIDKKPLPGEKEPKIPKINEEELDMDLESKGGKTYSLKEVAPKGLEKETISRIRNKKKEKDKKKIKKTSEFSKIASQIFSKYSRRLLGQQSFKNLEHQLIKANLDYTPVGYISMIILGTVISLFAAGFLFLFFLFFSVGAELPIITRAIDPLNIRFLKVVWILIAIPALTFLFMYFYPSIERKAEEEAINSELPFATINMAAISGSMVDPSKIFEIIISTGEYPALKKQFTKMINQIGLYGYDLVTALKDTANNSPSKEFSELLNGLSVTIHSGGDLVKFFDKRAQTLMFNYKIEQQRESKAAETSMDIYISVGIASPMILMLLLIIMKISGLGISMSINLMSLLVIVGVLIINIVFMASFHLRRKK